jgi:flavin reductase (DIM6/NTAB) family NADH-FMN oxidoreductase RutF
MKFDPDGMSKQDIYNVLVGMSNPRPLVWVSTVGQNGVNNLAPFSFFSVISAKPALVGLSVGSKRGGQKKDTILNIEYTGDFVINTVNEELAESMNQSSYEYPPEVDEFKETGLTALKSDLVKSPRLAESAVNVECEVNQIMQFGSSPDFTHFIIGNVRRVHVRDDCLTEGVIDGLKVNNIGRLWGKHYCRLTDLFGIARPE